MAISTTRAEIEKVVRKVLQEEQGKTDEATLKAVQRVSTLLTTQVIPKLSDDSGEGRAATDTDDVSILPVPEEPEVPEEGDEPPAEGIPQAAKAAFEELYKSLSAEQAQSLAALFTAIGEEPGGDEEVEEDVPERPGKPGGRRR